MVHSSFIVVTLVLVLYIPVHVLCRPSRTVPYFPQYNPWNVGDIGIHAEDTRWSPYGFIDESSQKSNKYYSFDPSDKEFREQSSIKDDIQPSIPVYEKGKGGFVPPGMSALDKVYWWDKRFNNFDVPPAEDLPNFIDDADYETNNVPGTMKKRDYTAAQLVNILKALAKTRRQRHIRIAGKGLRFGISR